MLYQVKTSAIDEAIRVICDRIQPSDMPVSKIPHDPSWLSAEVEFNIQNSSLCPPVFFNPDVGSELLKLAESLGLSFQKRFSFEELERRCMGKGDQDDETTTDLSEPAEVHEISRKAVYSLSVLLLYAYQFSL